jgi:polyisoprenoid-binding protein YceI
MFSCLLITLSFFSCSRAPKGDQAVIEEKQMATAMKGKTFVVDTAESKIRFTGHGVGKNHPGDFKLSSGKISVSNNTITGGSFIINIQSLDLEQKDEKIQSKLKPHLMSGDFFDAEKFRTAMFEITGVTAYQPTKDDSSIVAGANFLVSGNFTLKDVTKNISFPAHIDLDNNTIKSKANFNIDRTQWEINYGSDKTLGDKFISEKVNIELNLKANAVESGSMVEKD